ncbi:hypothetical protein BT63DRAFT_421760 [Microthyrium microscopicum]|uniref:Ankyrin n=1 Tax=Microthyrium microscopicum TaxID=703497 RepID=A0A6A6UPD6_9PEZI|nr:hypothetical protein BT63DRAFT_421760 [Microthyrium microscopicum]
MASHETLCFDEAFRELARAHINETAFWSQILLHFQGVRHPADKTKDRITGQLRFQYWASLYSIRHIAVDTDYTPLSEDSIFVLEKILRACTIDNLKVLESDFHAFLAETPHLEGIIQPMALLSVEFNSTDCLRFCLENGATVHDELMDFAVERSRTYTTSPQLLGILFEHGWREMNELELSKLATQAILLPKPRSDTSGAVQWMLEHGAKLQSADIREAVRRKVPEKTLALLIALDRKAATTFGSVHAAMIAKNPEAVKLLLEAGACPDHPWHDGFDERESSMNTPIIESIRPTKIADPDTPENLRKRLAIARLLLEHGADTNEIGYSKETIMTALARCNVGKKQFEKLFEEFGVDITKTIDPATLPKIYR